MDLPAFASQEVAAQRRFGALLGRHATACWPAQCEKLTINGNYIDSSIDSKSDLAGTFPMSWQEFEALSKLLHPGTHPQGDQVSA